MMKNASTTTRKLQKEIDVATFLNEMKTGEVVSIDAPETPPWFQAGTVYEISEVTYKYFAETTILRWVDTNVFVASEVGQPLQLFWIGDGIFFGRQLSAEESLRFCQLTGTKVWS